MPKNRDCDEEPRTEGKRHKKITFDFEDVKRHFDENINDVKAKFDLANREKINGMHFASEIWRSQIVFLDSALDFYIHEVAKLGIIKIFNNEWDETNQYREIKVSMDFALRLADSYENADNLLGEIDEINQKNCFMGFDNLQKILRTVGLEANKDKKGIVDALYKRRNQIAHQSDRLPNVPDKQPIDETEVQNYISSIESLVSEINQKIEELNNR